MASSSVSNPILACTPTSSNPAYKHTFGAVSYFKRNNASFGNFSLRSPVALRSPPQGHGQSRRIIAMASGDTSGDIVKSVQEAWEKTDDKLAIVGLGFAGVIILWASIGLVAAIDKLPLLPNAFEFVGIVFSGWFIYRYLLFKPDRAELAKNIESALAKITGNES